METFLKMRWGRGARGVGGINMFCKCVGIVVTIVAILIGGLVSGEFARLGVIRFVVENLVDSPRPKGIWPATVDLAAKKHWTYDKIPKESLKGKVAIVTGGNVGLGYHTSLELARKGATVVVGCRSMTKCKAACAKINQEIRSSGSSVPMIVDMAKFSSVRAFSKAFLDRHSRLDIFVQNAGIPSGPVLKLTDDGIERTMHTNHFGHAQMTHCLESVIQKTAAQSPVRIVAVSSGANYGAPEHAKEWMVSLQGINSEANFNRTQYYPVSKLANILFAKGLAAHYNASNIIATSVHPGMVETNIWESDVAKEIENSMSLHSWVKENIIMPLFLQVRKQVMWTSSQGAWTQTYLAVSASASQSGEYFHPVARPMPPNKLADDKEFVYRFWEFTQNIVQDKC